MKVKVINAEFKSLWYANKIGEVFEVTDNGGKYYNLVNADRCINKQSAEVVEDVEKNCETCNYCGAFDECLLTSDCNNFSGWVNKPTIVKNGTTKPAGKFENIGRALGELVDEKQHAYGDAITAVEQMMMVLYPNGVSPDQYRDMLLMVRIMDKQCRIAKGDKTAFGENPFRDIAGYGLLGVGHGGKP